MTWGKHLHDVRPACQQLGYKATSPDSISMAIKGDVVLFEVNFQVFHHRIIVACVICGDWPNLL